MKERGMIFNAEMVRAILDGRKTQTRRIMKKQPEPSKAREGDFYFPCNKMQSMVHVSDFIPGNSMIPDAHEFFSKCCPFGEVGDRIWVRETWARYNIDQDSHDMAYRATTPEDWPEEGRWRPSIHMPRWASRITLEITGVRVERLQSISPNDASREGLIKLPATGRYCLNQGDQYFGGASHDAREVFSWLWESIYGAESWQSNPWVWVIEFKRIEGGGA
ncbi:morphogenetic protein [Enterobacter hormaechei]|uniref:morphogenetic protein n=1 Tax=Enterobacter cloacae complex TaxID=354276 RepID=UPI00294A972B|nr:morphogenetic protein [Enterobacter hormaechei]MDV5252236.1 morphogenetic protein [Enterobacter hormaechei]MDV5401122.1 morphogenetic protein [Enterobacter hormaechei]MDV5617708.1 morphogenetic protein [Enterobacter hormaechei]